MNHQLFKSMSRFDSNAGFRHTPLTRPFLFQENKSLYTCHKRGIGTEDVVDG